MEMPTIRLGRGLQDLGRHQPRARTPQPSPIPAESPWGGGSRSAGLAPAAPGGGVDAGPRRPGQGQGPPQAVPQGRNAPLTRPGSGMGSAGWPRQRPVRGRVQGPGRGAGTAGEAVQRPHSRRSRHVYRYLPGCVGDPTSSDSHRRPAAAHRQDPRRGCSPAQPTGAAQGDEVSARISRHRSRHSSQIRAPSWPTFPPGAPGQLAGDQEHSVPGVLAAEAAPSL
jgi:hypothetical protein